MKKTIGYKVGSMVQIPNQISPNGFKSHTSTQLRPFPSPKNDDLKSIDPEKSPKIGANTKKLLKELHSPPKESVEAVEREKIELIRNMIKEELQKQKKNFVKTEFKDMIVQQIQQLNLELIKFKNQMIDPKSQKTSPISKIDEVRLLVQKQIKSSSEKTEELIQRSLKQFQGKIETKLKVKDSGIQSRLDQISSKLNKGLTDINERVEKQIRVQSVKGAGSHQLNTEDIKFQGKKSQAAGRMAALETNISTILSKLQGYNSVLDQLKDATPTQNIKLSQTVSKLAEENKQRRKQTSELHKDLSILNKALGSFGQRLQAQESTLQEKVSKIQRKVNLKDIHEAIEDLHEQLANDGKSFERVNHEIHKARQDYQDLEMKLVSLDKRLSKIQPQSEQNIISQDYLDNTVQDLHKQLETKFSQVISEYNQNFRSLQQSIVDVRDITFDVIDLNKSLTSRLQMLFSTHSEGKQKLAQVQKLNEEAFIVVENNSQKLMEINRKDLCFEHEIRLLRDRVDQLECLNTRRRLLSTDSANSEGKTGSNPKAKENKHPAGVNQELRSSKRVHQRTSLSLQEQKVYDQFGLFQ